MNRFIAFVSILLGLGIFGYMAADHLGLLKSNWIKVQERAESGDASAQFYVGWVYAGSSNSQVSKAQAVVWYRKAAEQGYAEAQTCLGAMLIDGEGVPKDLSEGYAWLLLARAGNVQKPWSAEDIIEKAEARLSDAERVKAHRWADELARQIEARKKAAGK